MGSAREAQRTGRVAILPQQLGLFWGSLMKRSNGLRVPPALVLHQRRWRSCVVQGVLDASLATCGVDDDPVSVVDHDVASLDTLGLRNWW